MRRAAREVAAGRRRLLVGAATLVARICLAAPPSPGLPRAGIFGVEATGTRFAYVFDRSASMDDPAGRPLAAAKRELLASIEALGDARQFHVIFYNERLSIFAPPGPPGRPIFASQENSRAVRRFVDAVQAHGGTRHYEAVAAALKLAPDAIFMLTDADVDDDLTEDELGRLLKSRRGTRCLVVQLGAGSGRRSPRLARLAAESGGEYRTIEAIGEP
ncbi:MAG: hypothetical protein DWI03_08780 [Planctomycetota bacterium]|nr:MAG: hypothetical protein DWI03_08780 [Planctomycetota bacterium]